jgi:hypothetical protein
MALLAHGTGWKLEAVMGGKERRRLRWWRKNTHNEYFDRCYIYTIS